MGSPKSAQRGCFQVVGPSARVYHGEHNTLAQFAVAVNGQQRLVANPILFYSDAELLETQWPAGLFRRHRTAMFARLKKLVYYAGWTPLSAPRPSTRAISTRLLQRP